MMATKNAHEVKLIRCTIGNTNFCLDIDQIRGVERGDRLERIPCDDAPSSFRNRGVEWSVFAPSRWFGPSAHSTSDQFVLLESRHGRFGIAVDRVTPIGRVAEDRIVEAPSFGSASRWLSCVYQSDDGPVAVLDANRLNDADIQDESPFDPTRSRFAATIGRKVATDRWLAIGWQESPGGRSIAIVVPVSIVVEVVDAPPATRVPGAPEHVRGLIEWRGRPLVVAEPSRWVGLSELAASPRVVVVRSGGRKIGLAAGTTVKVLTLNAPCIPSRHAIFFNPDTTLGAFDTTDATLVSPNWEAFLQSLTEQHAGIGGASMAPVLEDGDRNQ
jgi:purine-binding chemotaxis protein CheW